MRRPMPVLCIRMDWVPVRISEKPWTGFTGQLSGEIRKLSWEWGIFIRTAGDLYAMNRLLSTGIAEAAAHGNSDAMNNIGYMYRNGLGVPRNYEEALFWFQKAANLGNSSAQYNIGNLYCWGKG